MNELFVKILSISWQASFVALGIILLRMLMRKLPRIYGYGLWSILFLRLVVPVSVESSISLLPRTAVMENAERSIAEGTKIVFSNMPFLYAVEGSSWMNDTSLIKILSVLYYLILSALLLHFVYSIWRVHQKTLGAKRWSEDVFVGKAITRPFAYGVFTPRIYMPIGLEDPERAHVIAHEKVHLRRRDPLVKAAAYVLLLLHWFNPLLWVSYVLMVRDMEISCDEEVLRTLNPSERKGYVETLLALECLKPDPVVFAGYSGGNLKERVQHILRFSKPTRALRAASLSVLILAGAFLLTNPPGETLAEIMGDSLKLREVVSPFGDHLDVYEYEEQMLVGRKSTMAKDSLKGVEVLTMKDLRQELWDEITGMMIQEALHYRAGDRIMVMDQLADVYYTEDSDKTYLVFAIASDQEEALFLDGDRRNQYKPGMSVEFLVEAVPLIPGIERFIRFYYETPEPIF